MSKKLADHFLLLHHSINTEYLKYDKIPEKHRAKDREELRFIVKAICECIGKNVVEKPAGVHVRRLGYFFIWKIPRKMTYTINVKGGSREEKFNYHSDNYMYSPVLLPSLDAKNSFKRWSMDNSFVGNIKQGIKRKVRAGFKYKMYPYSIMKLNRI